MNKIIYMDNAATTQVYPEVLEAMNPFFTEYYGNPSALYSFADEAENAVDKARDTVADLIGAKKEEIYFTGGGSESDNWALKATAEAYAQKGKHIITSKIEHHAILHTCKWLEKQGFDVIGVDASEDMLMVANEKKYEEESSAMFLCQKAEELDLFGTIDCAVCCLDTINHIDSLEKVEKAISLVSLFLY